VVQEYHKTQTRFKTQNFALVDRAQTGQKEKPRFRGCCYVIISAPRKCSILKSGRNV
jgi:hypothetical protein